MWIKYEYPDLSLIHILPLYNAVIVSLTPYSHMLEPMLYPKYFHISNFTDTFALLYRQLLNSFLYAIVTVILDCLLYTSRCV